MKFKKAKLAQVSFLLVLILPAFAFALPEGENVVSGSAAFDRSQANTLSVNTPSERLIVNYNSFSIAQPETVRFQQPSASAIVLNRVVGVDPSSIMGTLSANGKVFIVNPNGVIFGPDSQVDVAGLVASSLNISNDDFLNGNYVFSKGAKNGYVINQGTIKVLSGGYVCLLGGAVDNRLAIQADLGTVVLASGEKITLALEDQNAISVVVDEAVQSEVFGPDGVKMASAVKNSGTILAEGGKVILTAKILNKVFDYSINNTGLVKVTSLVKHDGVIELMAEGAPVVNSGTLEAEQVYIKVSNDRITNTAEGKIVAEVSPTALIGGNIFLEAATILQQGFISANVEQGTAGEISFISVNNTILDENSRTEARATGISGNGGKITIDSKQGSVFVNKNAKIDFSAGSLAGNGGLFKVDAFAQLGFYGILNGRAPPGFTPGKAILDPQDAYLGDDESQINSDFVLEAYRNIYIVGPVVIGEGYTLRLFADTLSNEIEPGYYEYYPDNTFDPGVGSIINTGDYVISSPSYEGAYMFPGYGTYLEMRAGSGIGSIEQPIYTNVSYLSAETLNGDIFIEQDGGTQTRILNISSIYSPGLVVIMSSGPISTGVGDIAIEADELYLEAVGGIGDEGVLDISVDNLVAINDYSGRIRIRNDKDLVVLVLINYAGEEATEIESEGSIRVRYGIAGNGDISLDAYGDIFLNTIAGITAPAWADVSLTAQTGSIERRNLEVEEFGLKAYWNFDQYYSYYYAEDASGNGYSAYCSGTPEIVEGVYGQALYFDGVNDYINIGTNFGFGAGPFTLICWYQGTQSLNNVGLMGASPYPYTTGYALETHFGQLQYWVNNSMNRSAITINDGSWYQLAMVRDAAEGSLYIFNNDEVKYETNFAVPEGSVDTSASFWIGGWGNTKRLTQGALDDVRVYAAALSGLEIYAQTQITPGQGRISAGNVELNSQTGIDVGFGDVSDFYTSNVSGDLRIDSLGALTVSGGDFPSIDYHNGNISLISAADIYVDANIYTIGDYAVYLSAEGDIVLAKQVIVYSANDYYQQPSANVTTGDITLDAGGDIIFGRGASVYSQASSTSPVGGDTSFAESGNISLTAGNNITMEWGRINSTAQANGYDDCTAYSGDVVLSAGNILTETGFGDLIYSYANANAYENPDSSAFASSGLVSLYAGNSLTIDGTEGAGYPYNGADVYSRGYATGGFSAVAYSSSVSLATGSGDITLRWLEVRSDADAQTYTEETPGTLSEAFAGDYYGAISIESGGSIVMADNTLIYGAASAQGVASHAYAQAGDVSLDADDAITLASHVYSEALTYGYDLTESISGKVRLNSYNGPITVPNTAMVGSNATSNVIGAGEAYATSGDVMVRCLYGPVTLNQAVYSSAEAYGDEEMSPSRVEATSGDVSVGSGYNYVEYYTEIYGSYYADYYDSDEYYYGDALTLNVGYVYSNPHTSNATAADLVFESGDITLYGDTISLVGASVYSGAGSDGADPLIALNSAHVTAGNIGIYASGNISLSGSSDITSRAMASGLVGALATSAWAESGSISLRSDYGDITLGSAAALVYDLIQSYASASEATDLSAVSGAVSLMAGNDIFLLPSAYDYPVESLAVEGLAAQYPGDLSLTAMGDITVSQNLRADTISILADADWSGDGKIIKNAGVLYLYATRFNLSGAQDLVFAGDDGLYVSSYGLDIRLILPSELSIPGLSLASTYFGEGESILTIDSVPYGGELVFEYMRLYSAGDIKLYTSLAADTIELIADYNGNGYGDLFSYVPSYATEGPYYIPGDIALVAWDHRIQAAGSFDIMGDLIHYGSGEIATFGAELWTPGDGSLGDLAITATSGSVMVTESFVEGVGQGEQLERTGYTGINIWSSGDIVIDRPILVEYGTLSLTSDGGSIVAGGEGLTHITAASNVYLRAGNLYTIEGINTIGTINMPLKISLTAGELALEVYGQTPFEGIGPVSGNLFGVTPSMGIEVLNDAPGVVYFNDAPAPEPSDEGGGSDNGGSEGEGSGSEEESSELPPQTPYIISYETNPVDMANLNAFQQSSITGQQVFLYHPVSETDMAAFDQLLLGADAYQLQDGELKLIGHDSLLQFFQEFDQKRKQGSL